MKTHGPYNATTTIIKIDNELKQEDTAASCSVFLVPFLPVFYWGTVVYYGTWCQMHLRKICIYPPKNVLREGAAAVVGETSRAVIQT